MTHYFFFPQLQMATNDTPPALRLYRVFADHVDRAYQEIEAESPARAHEIAGDQPEAWESCFEHAGSDEYQLSGDVQDVATEEYHQVTSATHCKTCGSEIVETVNGSNFGDGECGPCEYARYRTGTTSSKRDPLALDSPNDVRPPDGRSTAEWSAADMRGRLARYPALHAEDKLRLAMDIFWEVNETWDHDTLERYPDGLPSFDEYLTTIGRDVYQIRWSRPNSFPADAHGNAA